MLGCDMGHVFAGKETRGEMKLKPQNIFYGWYRVEGFVVLGALFVLAAHPPKHRD